MRTIHSFEIDLSKDITSEQLEKATEKLNEFIEHNDEHLYVGDLDNPTDRTMLFNKIKLDHIMEGFTVRANFDHNAGIAHLEINLKE